MDWPGSALRARHLGEDRFDPGQSGEDLGVILVGFLRIRTSWPIVACAPVDTRAADVAYRSRGRPHTIPAWREWGRRQVSGHSITATAWARSVNLGVG